MLALPFNNGSEMTLLTCLVFLFLLKFFQNAHSNLQSDARITFMFWEGFCNNLLQNATQASFWWRDLIGAAGQNCPGGYPVLGFFSFTDNSEIVWRDFEKTSIMCRWKGWSSLLDFAAITTITISITFSSQLLFSGILDLESWLQHLYWIKARKLSQKQNVF